MRSQTMLSAVIEESVSAERVVRHSNGEILADKSNLDWEQHVRIDDDCKKRLWAFSHKLEAYVKNHYVLFQDLVALSQS